MLVYRAAWLVDKYWLGPDMRNRIGLCESGINIVVTYLRQGQQHNVTLMTVLAESRSPPASPIWGLHHRAN